MERIDGWRQQKGWQASCPICQGTGFTRMDVPVGHPHFGKAMGCVCQQAAKQQRRQRELLAFSQLDRFELLRSAHFSTFNLRVPGVQEAHRAAKSFAYHPKGWLLLVGNNGCGKTHLALAMTKVCLERGLAVLFAVVPDLLDLLRATVDPDTQEQFEARFLKLLEADVLILDNLGTQQRSPWADEKLFQVLNHRYNTRTPTVITTHPRELHELDEHIRSRLSDASLVTTIMMTEAQDYRPFTSPKQSTGPLQE